MTSEEQQVTKVVQQFYDALEIMATGGGIEPMIEIWHHVPYATASHPLGDWAYGWAQVLATWKAFTLAARAESAGGHIRDLHVHVCGDAAHSTCVYVASPVFGPLTMNCTNVLQRIDGVWKIILHHADKAPTLEAALEQRAE